MLPLLKVLRAVADGHRPNFDSKSVFGGQLHLPACIRLNLSTVSLSNPLLFACYRCKKKTKKLAPFVSMEIKCAAGRSTTRLSKKKSVWYLDDFTQSTDIWMATWQEHQHEPRRALLFVSPTRVRISLKVCQTHPESVALIHTKKRFAANFML